MSAADLQRMCELMVQFGLTRIQQGDAVLERPAALVLAEAAARAEPTKTGDEAPEDAFDRIKRMDPLAQDHALMLGDLKP